MSYKYNENYSVYENKVLNDMAKTLQKYCVVTYVASGSYTSLVVSDFYNRNVDMAIILKDNNFVLLINGKNVQLTPVIIQKCQELLLQYKKPRIKSQKKDSERYEYEKGIIATEQSRDIYKMVSGIYLNNRVFTKVPRQDFVFLPNNVKVKRDEYSPKFEYRIGYPTIKKKIAQRLFNDGKIMYMEPQKCEDGKYHLTINGNDFAFLTYDFAEYFTSLFDERLFVLISKPVETTTFIRYKDKTRRAR